MSGTEEFNCQCNTGFEGKRCETDLCDGVICENGFCEAGNCICNAGYIKIENICEETCDSNPCKVFKFVTIQVIIRLKRLMFVERNLILN